MSWHRFFSVTVLLVVIGHFFLLTLVTTLAEPQDRTDEIQYEAWLSEVFSQNSLTINYVNKPPEVVIGVYRIHWDKGQFVWQQKAVRQLVCTTLKQEKMPPPIVYKIIIQPTGQDERTFGQIAEGELHKACTPEESYILYRPRQGPLTPSTESGE